MPETFDVIVVGARCAGSPLAAMLARDGASVAVVDKATFPRDTLSTHNFQADALSFLDRLGVTEQLRATGAPYIKRVDSRADDFRWSMDWPLRPGDIGGIASIRRASCSIRYSHERAPSFAWNEVHRPARRRRPRGRRARGHRRPGDRSTRAAGCRHRLAQLDQSPGTGLAAIAEDQSSSISDRRHHMTTNGDGTALATRRSRRMLVRSRIRGRRAAAAVVGVVVFGVAAGVPAASARADLCPPKFERVDVTGAPDLAESDRNGNGFVCTKSPPAGGGTGRRLTVIDDDKHPATES